MEPQHHPPDLSRTALPDDTVGLLEGLTSTRAIRRYRDEDVPDEVLRAVLFAATRAPSGSNRQPFRFVVLRNGPVAARAKALIGAAARDVWGTKRDREGYADDAGSAVASPRVRLARTMQRFVDDFERVPVLVLACLVRYREPDPSEGASIYPACQNLLLACRALGYGGVMTGWHRPVETELRELVGVPDGVAVAAVITIGRPEGAHGPVRRLPLHEFVFEEHWGKTAVWAEDPPGVRHSRAGVVTPPGGAA